MVALREITKKVANSVNFNTIAELQIFVKERVPNYKKLNSIDDLLDKINVIISVDEKKRAESKQTIITQDIINRSNEFFKYKKGGGVLPNPYSNNNNNKNKLEKLKVVFIKPFDETTRKLIDDSFLNIKDSQSILPLIYSLRRNFKPVFGNKEDIHLFKENVYSTIKDFFPEEKNKDLVDQIFNSINIKTVNIKNNTSHLLYYVAKNSSYRDFGDVIIQKFCVNNFTDLVNNQKNNGQFGCFFKCLLTQSPLFFKAKKNFDKLCYFDAKYNGTIQIGQMEEVAKAFEMNIIVLDIEFFKIQQYNYRNEHSSNKTTKHYYVKNIILIVKDNHVYSFNQKYNKTVLKNIEKNNGFNDLIHTQIFQKNKFIKSIKEKEEAAVFKSKDIECCKDENVKLVYCENKDMNNKNESNNEDNDNIIIKEILYKNENIINNNNKIKIYYVDSYEDILKIYNYYRTTKNIIGALKENTIKNYCELRIENTFFRNRDYIYFDSIYNPKYTFSYSSVAKYLFQKFIDKPIEKKTNLIINDVYKSMCVPLVKRFYCDQSSFKNKYIYYLDLNKAYFGCSDNLNVPENYIKFIKENDEEENEDSFDVYFSKSENKWKWNYNNNNKDDVLAYIPIKEKNNNILKDFGKYIRKEEGEKPFKTLFNCLIGSMQPGEFLKSLVVYFHNEEDFCRFMLNNRKGKKIINIEVNEEFKLYKVQFVYETESSQYQSFNLSFWSAQIIQRCRKKVLDMKEKIETENKEKNAKVVMCMTDSCIIVSDDEIENDNNEWSLKSVFKNKDMYIGGIGKYCITEKNNDKIIYSSNNYNPEKIEIEIEEEEQNNRIIITEKIINNNNNIILVKGTAGCGKTRWIKKNFWDRNSGNYIILGSTGVSANNLDTVTFHSFFGLVDENSNISEAINKRMKDENIIAIKNCESIVIDEFYMLRENDIWKMNLILKFICCEKAEFGGKKIFFVGDDRQLMIEENSKIKFNKEIIIEYDIQKSRIKNIEYKLFTDFFRDCSQGFFSFKKALEKVKENKFSKNFIEDTLTVFFTNKEVELFNELKRKNEEKIENGEPIMLNRNIDIKNGFFNGRLGEYYKENDNEEYIVINNNEEKKYCKLEKDFFNLAYAVTIHKSQGLTLEKGINIGILESLRNFNLNNNLDLLYRLMYVALTRVRDFKYVYLF